MSDARGMIYSEMDYRDETIMIAKKAAPLIATKFIEEVQRLLASKGVDPDDHHRGMLFGVALENVADAYIRDMRKTGDYKNIKRF